MNNCRVEKNKDFEKRNYCGINAVLENEYMYSVVLNIATSEKFLM